MTMNPEHEENEPQPEKARPFIDDPSEIIEEEETLTPSDPQEPQAEESESESPSNDPLSELRQNLFEQEEPFANAPTTSLKNGIFQRMTGNLASRKVPTQPNDQPGMGFGVRTAGQPPFIPPSKINANEDESAGEDDSPQNEQAFRPSWPRPRYYEEDEEDEAIELPASQDGLSEEDRRPESRVRPPSKIMDPLWDGSAYEVDESGEGELSEKEQKSGRNPEERKQLPSGYERKKQVSPYISYNPKRSLGDQIHEMSGLEKTLLVMLIVAIIAVGALLGYLYLERNQPELIPGGLLPPPTATAVVGTPEPTAIRFTGGWLFPLSKGVMVDGQWNPTTSEWLDGWEIRRVIAIPWNKQIQAVVQTFNPGDNIELLMSNGDILEYKVVSVSEVPVTDTNIMYDTKPSLAVILNQPDAEMRWVVVAEP